jgi:hypothetical protein
MSLRRPLLVLAVAAATVGSLAACDKPLPYANIVSGSSSQSGEASEWCFEAGYFSNSQVSSDCKGGPVNAGAISVHPGRPVEVDVPTGVGDDGWALGLTSSQGTSAAVSVVKGHSVIRFTVPDTATAGTTYVLDVLALHKGKDVATPRGLWKFVLNVKDAV